MTGIVGAEVFQHGAPYLRLDIGVGLVELDLVEEAALEGAVEVAREVGGRDEDTVEVFHLLQDDVLHGVLHLVDGVLDVLRTLVEDCIGLIEEEDGLHLAVAADVAIAGEDGLDVLLSLTDILVAHAGDVDLHEVASRLTGYLQHSLGLTGTRSAIEETSKALAHALLLESLLDGGEVVLTEQTGEAVDMLLVGSVEEEGLLLDGLMILHEAALVVAHALTLRVTGCVGGEQLTLGSLGEHVLLVVGHALDALVLDEATNDERVVTVLQMLTHEVAIILLGVEFADGLEGESFAVGTFPLGIVEDYHQQE